MVLHFLFDLFKDMVLCRVNYSPYNEGECFVLSFSSIFVIGGVIC